MSSETITKNDLAEILSKIPIATSENLPGIIKMFAGTFAPTGWLLCNGAEVAIEDYPALYDVIQDTYGTASDSDHFVLPDFRGRIPVGSGLGTATDSTNHVIGQKAGTEDAIIPYHNHSVNAVSITSSGGHKHNIASKWDNLKTNQTSGTTFSSIKSSGANSTDNSGGITIASNTGAHTHSVPQHNTNYAGSSGNVTGANMQPYTVVNYIISTGGVSRWADSAGLPIVRDVTVNGQSVVNNEIAQIPTGEIRDAYNETAVSLPTATGTAVTSITLEAGTWLITFGARFSTNATGERRACISPTAGSSDSNINAAPLSGAVTQIVRATIVHLDEERTYYLNLYQTSGSTLSAPASGINYGNFIRAIRIA